MPALLGEIVLEITIKVHSAKDHTCIAGSPLYALLITSTIYKINGWTNHIYRDYISDIIYI